MSTLTEAQKEAWASCPASIVGFDTIEISHPSISPTIFLVNSPEPLTAHLEPSQGFPAGIEVTFEKSSFELVMPKKSEDGTQDLQLSVCNVDRRISKFLAQAANYETELVVKYRPYLSNDLSKPQLNPPLTLTLSQASSDDYVTSARATFADLLNKPFPNEMYNRQTFPGIG